MDQAGGPLQLPGLDLTSLNDSGGGASSSVNPVFPQDKKAVERVSMTALQLRYHKFGLLLPNAVVVEVEVNHKPGATPVAFRDFSADRVFEGFWNGVSPR
jgi:hypothetical protein